MARCGREGLRHEPSGQAGPQCGRGAPTAVRRIARGWQLQILMVTGVGGTGVVTIGNQLLGMAAHARRTCRRLYRPRPDWASSQKGGSVISNLMMQPGSKTMDGRSMPHRVNKVGSCSADAFLPVRHADRGQQRARCWTRLDPNRTPRCDLIPSQDSRPVTSWCATPRTQLPGADTLIQATLEKTTSGAGPADVLLRLRQGRREAAGGSHMGGQPDACTVLPGSSGMIPISAEAAIELEAIELNGVARSTDQQGGLPGLAQDRRLAHDPAG